MHPPDPFWSDRDDDRTILRPSPGGRKRRSPRISNASPRMHAGSPLGETGDRLVGDNPIVFHAFSLLSVVPKIRDLPYHDDVDDLLHQMAGGIGRFENQLNDLRIAGEQVKIASYLLCTLIDETVLNTPWGSQSSWGNQSLLIQFHREAKGGERFFEILDRLRAHPEKHLNLLELAYLCLSFGFEGKHRHEARGMRNLDQLREDLYVTIRHTKGGEEQPLSAQWRGLQDKRNPIGKHIPIWVGAVVAGAVLMFIYMGFSYAINKRSNLTYQRMARTARETVRPAAIAAGSAGQPSTSPSLPSYRPPRMDRLKRLLSDEIARGMVEIVDGNVLRMSNSFSSGSDSIDEAYIPMLERIARELQHGNRLILVVGHTDNRPIFSARFPSNWHLSEARAKNVATIIAAAAPLEGRVRFEGRADTQPIGPNDTAAARARNRRIDIHIR